jgi:hypothetical protein
MSDDDCPMVNQTCSRVKPPMVCTCTNNTEACRVFSDMGMCRPSNISMCRACQVCIATTLTRAVVPMYNASWGVRVEQLNATCHNLTMHMSQLVTPNRCASMLALVEQEPDLASRAGALCTAMGTCDASLTGCMVNVSSSARLTPGPALSGSLDACSVEGVPGGAVPAGLVPPLGEHHALVCHIKSYACRPWPAPIAEETAVWMHMRMPVGDIADEASICTSHLC